MTDNEVKPEKNPVFRTFEEARKAGATGLIDIDPTLPVKPLPCPFCGGGVDFYSCEVHDSHLHERMISCANDDCEAAANFTEFYRTTGEIEAVDEHLLKKWNTRA